jgi:outer membrane immunogenic protein
MPDDRPELSVVSCQMGEVMRLRSLLCAVMLIGMAGEALAADLSDTFLRGSQTVVNASGPTRWDGFYVGGQVGYAWSGTDFSGATQSLVAFLLRNTTIEQEDSVSKWTTLGKYDANGVSFGGFAGWRWQFDEAVVGVEANYNRTSMAAAAGDSMRRLFTTSDGYNNDVTVIASSGIHITDYGTLRLSGGWAINSFVPYGFVGLAIGRADVSSSAQVIASGTSTTGGPPYSFNQTNTAAQTGAFAYGYTAGFGLDYAVTQNIFVRAEYEYVGFGSFNDLNVHIQTARVGAGVKF